MAISSIEELNLLFVALNKDFAAGRLSSDEYIAGLTELKGEADAMALPFIFSANDLLAAINPDTRQATHSEGTEPYLATLDELDAEPSVEEDYSEGWSEDSEGWDTEDDE